MRTAVVVGSGPGGSAAALALVEQGVGVTIVECGAPVVGGPASAFGTLLNGVTRLTSTNESIVQGGGSSINYGVWITPPTTELQKLFRGKLSQRTIAAFAHTITNKLAEPAPPLIPTTRAAAVIAQGLRIVAPDVFTSAGDDGIPIAEYGSAGAWVRAASTVIGDTRRVPYDLLRGKREARFVRGCVERVSSEPCGGWCVHLSDGRALRADTAFLSAGAIGTAALLQRSKLPYGVHRSVGANLLDHQRTSVLACFPREDRDFAVGARVPDLIVGPDDAAEGRVHAEIVFQPGVEAISTGGLQFLPCPSSRLLGLTPKWLTLSPSCDTTSCDPICCWPCSPTCNPCRSLAAVYVVVGARATGGHVRVQDGRTRVQLPNWSSEGASRVEQMKMTIVERLRTIWSCVIESRGPADTEWHYGGTVPYLEATDERGQVCSATGVPYEGLHVADMSLAPDLPSLNTQGLAAMYGYHIASRCATSCGPAACDMRRQ
jgi:hypothetical protein